MKILIRNLFLINALYLLLVIFNVPFKFNMFTLSILFQLSYFFIQIKIVQFYIKKNKIKSKIIYFLYLLIILSFIFILFFRISIYKYRSDYFINSNYQLIHSYISKANIEGSLLIESPKNSHFKEVLHLLFGNEIYGYLYKQNGGVYFTTYPFLYGDSYNIIFYKKGHFIGKNINDKINGDEYLKIIKIFSDDFGVVNRY